MTPASIHASRRRRTGRVSDAPVGAAEDQHLDELVEDDPVGNPLAVTA